jgi:hypothetical protein
LKNSSIKKLWINQIWQKANQDESYIHPAKKTVQGDFYQKMLPLKTNHLW